MNDTPPPTRRKRKERPDFGWPAAMKRATAAAYLDLSEPSFLKEVYAGRMPTSFMLGGRDHWRKDAIDACLERITGGGEGVPDYIKQFCERYKIDAVEYWNARKRKSHAR